MVRKEPAGGCNLIRVDGPTTPTVIQLRRDDLRRAYKPNRPTPLNALRDAAQDGDDADHADHDPEGNLRRGCGRAAEHRAPAGRHRGSPVGPHRALKHDGAAAQPDTRPDTQDKYRTRNTH